MLSESYKKRLQSLAGLNEAKETHKNEYGALMLTIDYKGWDDITSIIDKEDIYDDEPGFGLEKSPHVTVLYGFNNDEDYEKIKQMIIDNHSGEIKIKVHDITHFETPDYDVVKFDVKSEDMVKLNKLMTDNFEYTTDYPDYHPHMTIAYVKKGLGKKYNSKKEKIDMSGTELVYSPSSESGKKHKFNV